MSSWKLSNESRCSNSDTYFLTQMFITASHPMLRHYLWGNSRSLKPHRKVSQAVLVGSVTITFNWSKILFYKAFVSFLCFDSYRISTEKQIRFSFWVSCAPSGIPTILKQQQLLQYKDSLCLGRKRNLLSGDCFFWPITNILICFQLYPQMRGKGKIWTIIPAYSLFFLSPSGYGGRRRAYNWQVISNCFHKAIGPIPWTWPYLQLHHLLQTKMFQC